MDKTIGEMNELLEMFNSEDARKLYQENRDYLDKEKLFGILKRIGNAAESGEKSLKLEGYVNSNIIEELEKRGFEVWKPDSYAMQRDNAKTTVRWVGEYS